MSDFIPISRFIYSSFRPENKFTMVCRPVGLSLSSNTPPHCDEGELSQLVADWRPNIVVNSHVSGEGVLSS